VVLPPADAHGIPDGDIYALTDIKLFFVANKFAELFADALKQYHDNPSRNKYAK